MSPDGQDNIDAIVQSKCAFYFYNFHLCSLLMLCFSKHTMQLAAKTKVSKFIGERDPQTSRSSHVSVVAVKTETVDADEGRKRLSSPIVISSSEGEDSTPKSQPVKRKNFPSSLKKLDILNRASQKKMLSVKPTPRPTTSQPTTPHRKGKETASDTEEPVVDLPSSNQPLSETTVYLEDM